MCPPLFTLPPQIMVANIRCKEIKADQLRSFEADQAWSLLVDEAGEGLVRDFGVRAGGLADSCISG